VLAVVAERFSSFGRLLYTNYETTNTSLFHRNSYGK